MANSTLPEAELTAFEVQEIFSGDVLQRQLSEWSQLWKSASNPTPFQSPEWLLAWVEHLGCAQPWVLAIRSQERLVGLAPFCILHSPSDGGRHVILMGTGASGYLDILAETGFERTVTALIFNHLAQREGWDHCDFQQLRRESPLLDIDLGPTEYSPVEAQEPCPVLQVGAAGGWAIPAKFLQRRRFEEERLRKNTRLRFVLADEHRLEACLDAFFSLRPAGGNGDGHWNGGLGDTTRRFYESASQALLNQGVLRLHVAFDGQRPIACSYGLTSRGRAYQHRWGVDPAYETLGVGNQIVWRALQEARAEGATSFDFLRGQEPYKYRWGAVDRPCFRRQLLREPVFL